MIEWLPTLVVLLAAGTLAGLIAGLLGVGGGIVVVPVLFHLFGLAGIDEAVRMKLAVGTSLATIVATAWSSAGAHWRKGNVDAVFLKDFGPFVVAGVLGGAALASVVPPQALTALFAFVALGVCLQIAFGTPSWRLGEKLPGGWARAAIGSGIGMISALMGIGGGTLTVPLLTFYGTPIHRAVGSSAAMGFVIGVPGMLGFILGGWGAPALPPFSLGYVSLIGLILIAPASMAAAPLGAKLAGRMNVIWLRRAFALFLAASAARMLWRVLN